MHEEYNLIDNGLFIGLIFKAKYRVHKVLTNLNDKYTLIYRVALEDNNQQLTLVVFYCPNYIKSINVCKCHILKKDYLKIFY